jgi:hypothetical protein
MNRRLLRAGLATALASSLFAAGASAITSWAPQAWELNDANGNSSYADEYAYDGSRIEFLTYFGRTIARLISLSFGFMHNGADPPGPSDPAATLRLLGTKSNVFWNSATSTLELALPTPGLNTTYGLVGLYHFNEASGQTVGDDVGTSTNTTAENGVFGTNTGSEGSDPSWEPNPGSFCLPGFGNCGKFNSLSCASGGIGCPSVNYGDLVTFSTNPLGTSLGTQSWTLAAWVSYDGGDIGGLQSSVSTIVSNVSYVVISSCGYDQGYALMMDANRRLGVAYGTGNRCGSGAIPRRYFWTDATIEPMQWTHVAAVREWVSGQWVLKLYKNGVLVSGTDLDAGYSWYESPLSTPAFSIGNGSSANGQYFTYRTPWSGWIDDVSVYNVGLSAAQVAALGSRKPEGDYLSPATSTSNNAITQWRTLNWDPRPSATWPVPANGTGLVALWHMDDAAASTTLADSDVAPDGVAGDAGSVGGTTAPAATSDAVFGTGRFFDGVDDRVVVTDSADLDLTSNFTVSAWVRPARSAVSTTAITNILRKPFAYAFGFEYGKIRFYPGTGTGTAWAPATSAAYSAPGLVAPNVWHHVAAVHTGTLIKLYLDGSMVGSVAASAIGANTQAAGIGYAPDPQSEYFRGVIDELAIYNAARTDAEILADYQQGAHGLRFRARTNPATGAAPSNSDPLWSQWYPRATALPNNEPSLSGLWHLNSASGQSVPDEAAASGTNQVADNGCLGSSCATAGSGDGDPTWIADTPWGASALSYAVNPFLRARVTVPDSTDVNIFGPGSRLTIEAWVQLLSPVATGTIAWKGDNTNLGNGNEKAFHLYVNANNALVLDSTSQNRAAASLGSQQVVSPNNTIALYKWQHVAAVIDSTGTPTMKLYVDGLEVASAAYDASGIRSTGGFPMLIGGQLVAGTPVIGSSFYGLIDEVAVYRTALTPALINQHYGSQREAFYTKLVYPSTAPLFNGTGNANTVPAGKYLQYQAFYSSLNPGVSPQLISVTGNASNYYSDKPTVVNRAGAPFISLLNNFSVLQGPSSGQGSILFEVANAAAGPWYYYSATAPAGWKPSSAIPVCPPECNDAGTVTANLPSFPRAADLGGQGPGTLFWKAFLISDGTQPVELDRVSVSTDNSTLTLTSPAALAVWRIGSTNPITWTATGTIANVTLEYSLDNGATWTTVPGAASLSNAGNAGTFNWAVPANASYLSSQARVRIRALDASAGAFFASPAFQIIQLDATAPGAGAAWRLGDPNTISWVASSAVTSVALAYDADGDFLGPTTSIAAAVGPQSATGGCTPPAGGGCYVWDGAGAPYSAVGAAKVRVTGQAGAAFASADTPGFTLARLNVTAPVGTDTWIVGTGPHDVTWQADPPAGTLQLEYRPSSSAGWQDITPTDPAASALTHPWTIPAQSAYVSAANEAAVRASMTIGGTTLTALSAPFTVSKPTIQVSQPAGGVVGVETITPIVWTAPDGPVSTNLKIEYSTDGGTTWTCNAPGAPGCIAYGDSGGGSPVTSPFDWTVPDEATSPTVRIRITDLSEPFGEGVSALFKVAGAFNLVAPGLNDKWAVGKPHLIQWTNSGSVPTVSLFVSRDGGPEEEIDPGVAKPNGANGGSYSWTPAASMDATSAVLWVKAANDPDIEDDSAPFSLTKLAFTLPAGGERWKVGDTKTLDWDATGVAQVRLLYSPDPATIAFSEIAASVPAAGTFDWLVPDTVSKDKVQLRAEDAQASGASMAEALSSVFTIHGQLVLDAPNGGESWSAGQPHTIAWHQNAGTSIPRVKLEYSKNNFSTATLIATDVPTGATGTYDWSPAETGGTIFKVRVSDMQDPPNPAVPLAQRSWDESDNNFEIPGIAIAAPAGGEVWTVGETTRTIQWSNTGSIPQVHLEYSRDNFVGDVQSIQSGVLNTGTFPATPGTWAVPDGIGTAVRIRITAASDPTLYAISNPFTITGALAIPTPGTLTVGTDADISWSTPAGTIGQVHLEYSTDNATWVRLQDGGGSAATAIANSGTFPWRVPDAIATTARVRVVDAVAGHPVTVAASGPFGIAAGFAFTAPSLTDAWAVNERRNIAWTTAGTVGAVKLEFSTDDFTCAPGNCTTIINSAANGPGTYTWTVPDVISALMPPGVTPGDGLQPHSRPVRVRVSDADGPTHPASSAVSAPFTVKWYKITWRILSDRGPTLDNLSVNDLSSVPNWPGWVVTDDSVRAPIIHYYPASGPQAGDPPSPGRYNTVWSKTDFQPSDVLDWHADADKTIDVVLFDTRLDPTIYSVKLDHTYDAATQTLKMRTWLERQGVLAPTSTLGLGTVELFDENSVPLPTGALTFTPPMVGGALDPAWDGTYEFTWSPATLVPARVYFAKATIKLGSADKTSGATIQIGTAGTLTPADLQNALNPIGTQVGEIHTETVGTGSTLDQVKTGVSTTIPGLIGGVSGQVAGVQGTADLIKAETDKIQSVKDDTAAIRTETDKIQSLKDDVAGVTAYLSDPVSGLPAIQQQMSQQDTLMRDRTRALRRGGILNRDVELETGESATIQYRAVEPTLAPSIDVYPPIGAPIAAPMTLNPATGLFEYVLNGALLGEYRVVVTESPSADSAGTVDSITVTVREPLATAQGLTGIAGDLTNLIGELGSVETRLTDKLNTIQGTMATAAQAQVISDAVDTLEAKWGTLSAADLDAKLDGLAGQLGAVATTADLQTKFDALMSGLGTLATTADLQTKHDAVVAGLNAVRADIAALPQTQITDQTQRLTDIAGQLDGVTADLTALRGGDGSVEAILSQVEAVKQSVGALQNESLETGSLLAKLNEIRDRVASSEGSASAVGLAQSAYTAASEAVTLLHELKGDVARLSAGGAAPQALNQLQQSLSVVSSSLTNLPGYLIAEQESQDVIQIAEKLKALSSEKGYAFDSLFEMSQTQSKDVRTVKNNVEELKALLEVQKSLLDKNLNQPVIKTWFEAVR